MIASWCRRPDALLKLTHNEQVTLDKPLETVSENVDGEIVDEIVSYWQHKAIDQNALALGHLRTSSIADSPPGVGLVGASGSFKRSGSFRGPKFQLTCSLCDYSTTAMLALDFHMVTAHKLRRGGVEGGGEGGAVLTSKPELKSEPCNAERLPSPHSSGSCSQASPPPGTWEQGLEKEPTAPDEDRPLAHARINFLCGDVDAQFSSFQVPIKADADLDTLSNADQPFVVTGTPVAPPPPASQLRQSSSERVR
jgi:hypothetical protein